MIDFVFNLEPKHNAKSTKNAISATLIPLYILAPNAR